MNISEKPRPGNTKTVNAALVGLPIPALGVGTAGVVIGKKNVWKGIKF